MKKNLVKRIISGMSAMAIVASVMPSIPVSAYGNVVTPNKYKTLLNDTNSDNIIEKTVDLYYLPAWHGDGQTEYRNWTMPASLPTSYNIPEWNSYTWRSTSAGVINRDTYKASGSVVVNSFDTTKWTNSDCFEDTCAVGIYGVNNDSQIHYTFNIHNYAYTLREQEMDKLIAKYITPDMTDYEKVCKVIDIVAAGQYGSGDPLLTKSGDCIDAANAVVYLLRKLGIKARMRRCVDDWWAAPNHYNNYVIIDNELYIVDATCVGWDHANQSWDTVDWEGFTYEERIEIAMPMKRESYAETYIRKADSWEGLIGQNGGGLTDGKYVYRKLDDGTLALYDIVGLDGDTSATWTVPTTATINGTTYTVSTIGNIGNQTYQCTQTDLCENGRYGESYWYNTPYKQIIIPEGIKLSDEKSNLTNCFDNVEQITTNSSTTNLYNIFDSDENVLVIDGSNSTLKDVPYGAKTVYTNVTSELENYRIDVTGGYETEMPLCNVSDPNTRTLTGTVDIEVHNSNITLTNESGAIYYPILESDFKSFRFLGIPQGKYTFKVSVDGYEDYVQEVTVSSTNISLGYITPTVKHDHSYTSKVTKAASCETAGIKTYTCGICGDSYTETIPATGHSWNAGVITKAAGCETTGIKTYTCSKCGGTKTENIPATGHSYTDTVVEPTYTSEGYTLHTCIYCGDTYEDNYTPKLEETHTHSYTSTVTKAATCTATGIRTYTCSCGESYTEEIPKTAHSYTTKVVAPTCTAQGYTEHTCSKCGNTYKDTYTTATGHSYVTTESQPATCTESGYTKQTCSKCGDVKTTTIAATGHKYNATVVPPTYDSKGYTLHTCSYCGDSYKDNYTDKLTQKDIAGCNITLSATSYTYNGTAKKPAVTVKNGSTTLKNGTDYSTIYTNNVNAGTATVKITGRGNYTGTATKTYTISKANITSCTVKLSATSFVYDGNNKKPSVTVKNGSTVLKSGTDYSVTYTSCKNVGSAKVTISGKGNYANSIAKSYIIRPGNVANPKATTTTNTTATLAWDKMAGADGYYVYQYNPSTSKWNKKATTKQNKYKVTGLAAGTTYKFYVKAYKKISNSTYVSSSYTQIGTSTIPAKVNFTLTAGKNKATLKWKKQAGVTGYKIYYKASKNASWKGLAAPAKATTSYTKRGLKSGQTYYFAFRSYRVVNGKTYNGTLNWKTVKVK